MTALKNNKSSLYAVMRLNSKVEVINPFTKLNEEVSLGGCAGYIPVFDSIEEAEKCTCNGKYQILEIKI